MKQKNLISKESISELLKKEFTDRSDLILINISTVDGFPIYQVQRQNQGSEKDKVAAIASSLCSMSNSSAKEFFDDNSGIVSVESDTGKIICQTASVSNQEAIITICCKKNLSLAEARFIVKRLKTALELSAKA